ncbi:hypothetical protein EJB05_04920, partial [Eragrostis curvula]
MKRMGAPHKGEALRCPCSCLLLQEKGLLFLYGRQLAAWGSGRGTPVGVWLAIAGNEEGIGARKAPSWLTAA